VLSRPASFPHFGEGIVKGIMILDKIWHHVKQKQQKFWIWKALDRDSRQLFALERRHHDQAASNQMVQRPP
jgi:hypothetical protein